MKTMHLSLFILLIATILCLVFLFRVTTARQRSQTQEEQGKVDENSFVSALEMPIKESPMLSSPMPLPDIGEAGRNQTALPLSVLLGESGEKYLQDAVSGLGINLDVPIQFKQDVKNTVLVFPRSPGDLAWDGSPPVCDLKICIDNATGTILLPDGIAPPTDDEVRSLCMKWLDNKTTGGDYRLDSRRDIGGLSFALFIPTNGQENASRFFWIHAETRQVLDTGILFQ